MRLSLSSFVGKLFNRQSQAGPQSTGQRGEDIALNYLCGQGAKLIARNWRCRLGEIDLILWYESVLVFVEVKTRNQGSNAKLVFDAIGREKQRRLRRLVSCYLYRHYWRRVPAHRIDAVGVILGKRPGDRAEVRHLRGVVEAND